MKKIFSILLIISVAVIISGCGKQTTPDSDVLHDKTTEDTQTSDTKSTDQTEDKEESSNVELDITEQDLKQLKSDIQGIQAEDLNGLSQ